jgi:hypothetical protein
MPYTLCCTNFKASGQSDPDSLPLFAHGKPHVMYLHCMVQEDKFLESLCTRTIPVEAQWKRDVQTMLPLHVLINVTATNHEKYVALHLHPRTSTVIFVGSKI